MIAMLLRRVSAALLLISGTAAVAQSLPTPPTGYTPPAQPWATFNFASSSVNNNVSDGNSRTYTATSSLYGTFKVRITAWSIEKVCSGMTYNNNCYGTTSTVIRDSKLVVYDGGLGVISGDDDGGSNGQHTIDNEGRRDFLMFQFDRNVELVSASLNTYSVNGGTKDSDLTLMYGNTNIAWNSSLTSTLNDKPLYDSAPDVLDTLFRGSYVNETTSTGDTARWINTSREKGNIWLIGASFANPDSRIDGFKLESLSVVPEPQTWAMLIAGFGVVGSAMRRKARFAALAA